MYNLELISNIQYCYQYVIDQISVDLLFYTHVPTALIALLFASYLLVKNRTISSTSLAIVCICFSLWSILDLITWFVFVGDDITMFAWSLIDLMAVLFFFFTFRFIYSFITGSELSRSYIIFALIIITPTLVTTFFGLNLLRFDIDTCEAIENPTVISYTYVVQLAFIICALVTGIRGYKLSIGNIKRRKEILNATIGATVFLSFFFIVNLMVTLLVNTTALDYAYNFSLYGLFAMPLLLGFMTYLIVRFKTFNVRLIGAQALVFALWILLGSMLLLNQSMISRIVASFTAIVALIGGFFLVKSVKREVEQRENIELLAKQLQFANERLKELDKMKSEFVSIASHQLRSPLTSIRGYVSMLEEGSYGKLPAKVQQVVEKISDSAKYMAFSIEDYLNVSRIEAGNMKYELSDFNLKEIAEKVIDEMRPVAIKKGLVLVFRSDCHDGGCMTHADIGKTRQIIANLIDNSMKYTPKGVITLVVHNNPKKKRVYVTVQDTGVGMTQETLDSIFDKFVRARNANNVNVTGTGLGLYVAKKMVSDMGGVIVAESEGEGKGSTFHVELPLVVHKVNRKEPGQ